VTSSDYERVHELRTVEDAFTYWGPDRIAEFVKRAEGLGTVALTALAFESFGSRHGRRMLELLPELSEWFPPEEYFRDFGPGVKP
jgi:hypothetical protein